MNSGNICKNYLCSYATYLLNLMNKEDVDLPYPIRSYF